MKDTRFRTWMTDLCKPDGDRPEWPLLMQWMLQEQLEREQSVERTYDGKRILIPRHDHDYLNAKDGEKRATYGLYHNCLRETSGCLSIGDERYWLLSYEVPNQDSRKMQRADLLGLTVSGGLVVFECKLKNSYAPISSLLEGLDYLAALTSGPNFQRLQDEFQHLLSSVGKIPDGFEDVRPRREACHEVVVLAPSEYYETYDRSGRGTKRCGLGGLRNRSRTLRFGFATSNLEGQS